MNATIKEIKTFYAGEQNPVVATLIINTKNEGHLHYVNPWSNQEPEYKDYVEEINQLVHIAFKYCKEKDAILIMY
jgi:hypothetical protein